MVKVRQIVGGLSEGSLAGGGLSGTGLSEGSLAGGGLAGALSSPELSAGAVPWFRPFQSVPLSFVVVQILASLGFLGAAIQNFVNVHTEASGASQNTMSIIFLVLSIWFLMGWPLLVQSLA